MPPTDTPPLQLIVVEGAASCDPVTGICDPAPAEAPDAAASMSGHARLDLPAAMAGTSDAAPTGEPAPQPPSEQSPER